LANLYTGVALQQVIKAHVGISRKWCAGCFATLIPPGGAHAANVFIAFAFAREWQMV